MSNMITNNSKSVGVGKNPNEAISASYETKSNTNNNQGNNMGGGGGGGVTNLRDVCNFLQTTNDNVVLAPGTNPYDHIIEMLRGLDLHDDGIMMNHKIKAIETFFCNVVLDENMLCDSMEYINDKALNDQETSLKFAILFSSRHFDALAMKETKVRSAMIKILETNFLNADTYRQYDKNRLYNSITLLGEYYHRVRLASNTPITILGKSLLKLLISEVEDVSVINVKLAKLILSQITLNGDKMRDKHKDQLTQLLFHIRRNLIEQPALKAKVKALLLMTLDLYYSNFKNLGKQLEDMYTAYLVQDDDQCDDEDDLNINTQNVERNSVSIEQTPTLQQIQPAHQSPDALQTQTSVTSYDSLNDSNELDGSFSGKKWSEQVCEDSFYDNEFSSELHNSSSGTNDQLNTSFSEPHHEQYRSSSSRSCDQEQSERNISGREARRSYQPRSSPRPLKQNFSSEERNDEQWPNTAVNGDTEDRDQTKPLPRWRATRFNREGKDHSNDRQSHQPQHQQHNRRYSSHFEDDRQSERSEGGSIRLYSVNDRLKHSQEKFERSNMNFNIANWDRQSQRDDRSERSYLSNYERGNQRRGARHYNNNRQNYDKPPRFQKTQQQQQTQQRHLSPNSREQKIQSETWRRSTGMSSNYREYNNNNNGTQSYRSNGPEDADSRSSSRARTLPRPAKSRMDDGIKNTNYPQQRHNQLGGGNNNGQRAQHNKRYGSQNSLASEGSNTLERRRNNHSHRGGGGGHNYRNRSEDRDDDRHSVHSLNRFDRQNNENNWQNKNDSDELVRNAQETAKYMNYLSAKK